VVFALVALPIALPILPESTMLGHNLDKVRDDYSAELGWPDVVATIAHAYAQVPAGERSQALIVTENYSQASAVDLLGGRFGLPHALSGHNSFWLWLPPRASIATVLAVGFTPAQLGHCFAQVEPLGRVPDRRTIDVEERGASLYLCHRPLVTTKQPWAAIKSFS